MPESGLGVPILGQALFKIRYWTESCFSWSGVRNTWISFQILLTKSPHVRFATKFAVVQHLGWRPLDRELGAARTCVLVIQYKSKRNKQGSKNDINWSLFKILETQICHFSMGRIEQDISVSSSPLLVGMFSLSWHEPSGGFSSMSHCRNVRCHD